MKLTRADKALYWVFWFFGHSSGIIPYDWVSDWNLYLRARQRGLTPWQAWCDPEIGSGTKATNGHSNTPRRSAAPE